MSAPIRGELDLDGDRLVYDDYGDGDRAVLLLAGMLMPRRMQLPLARGLAERGHRVICLDLLGHGESDRPRDPRRYSMPIFGEQVVAALEALGVEEAVVGGASLGANVTLEAAVRDSGRVRGIVVEGAWLEDGQRAVALAWPLVFGPLTLPPVAGLLARSARLVPRGTNLLVGVMLDWLSQDPGPSAALMQGVFFGRKAPPPDERTRIEARALVIGLRRDPIHPMSDARALVGEITDARLVEAGSILELRTSPDRLVGEIAAFVDDCFAAPAASRVSGRRMRAVSA